MSKKVILEGFASMNINHQNNIGFKQINLVQVSKKAFTNPEVSAQCSQEFFSALEKASGETVTYKWSSFRNMFNLGRNRKMAGLFEYPSCNIAREELKKPGFNYSLYWLSENTGLDLKDKINPEKHSFFVLTGAEKNRLADMISIRHLMHLKNIASYFKSILKRNRPDMADTCYNLMIGVFLDKDFKGILADKPVKNFSIENLDDLKNITNEFGL